MPTSLLERLRDKDSAQAAVALAKLYSTQNPEGIVEDETFILDVVLEAMAYDTSS